MCGQPSSSRSASTSALVEIAEGVKVSRAILHGSADVLTFGLWEAVGTPTEAIVNGNKVAFEVIYDASDRVERVVPLRN